MKKFLLLVFAAVFAAACAAPPTNSPVSSSTNQNTAAETAAPAMTEMDAIAKEKAIWDTIKQKDYASFGAMLAEGQMEVMSEAVMDKSASVEIVKGFEPSDLTFDNWKFLKIDKDAFLITYTVKVKGKYQGKEFPEETTRCSSAWVYLNAKWQAMYHQESPLKPAMAMPTPAAGAAKAAPSAAASPVTVTTGPDPIANEKIVWDLFKSKNYDAFAALLDPDFMEVESEGVYDKAGSIKGVQMFDASKVVLSDWKTGKLDDDALLVTYVTKGPGMSAMGERNTTIWVNRSGKWMGLFHHGGTPVRPPMASPATKASPSPTAKASPSPAAKASPSPTAK